jgi:glucose dehydrogenase
MKPIFLSIALGLALGTAASAQAQNWPVYGGDSGNTRFSQSTQVNTGNVRNLKVA